MPISNSIKQFGNKVRIRVCGILENEQGILLIRHVGLSKKNLWLPPGGGVEFGETIEQALLREFKEETNLEVSISTFAGINEYIDDNLHAIELYYIVQYKSGTLKLGHDPELSTDNQLLKELKYVIKEEALSHIPQEIQKLII